MNEGAGPLPKALKSLENWIALGSLTIVLILCLGEIFARLFLKTGLPAAAALIEHFTLVFACVGAAIAAREGRQLGIADAFSPRGRLKTVLAIVRALISNALLWALFAASASMVIQAFDPAKKIGFIPIQLFAAVVPSAFLILAARAFLKEPGWPRVASAIGAAIGIFSASQAILGISYYFIGAAPSWLEATAEIWNSFVGAFAWPLVAVIAVSAVAGVPLFALLAGFGYIGFAATAGSVEVVPYQAYTMLTGGIIPAIPLFTLTGFILADSGAGKRLVSLLSAALGWVRGGPAIAAVVVSAFFTTFTGASGVTILALGGLMVFVLKESAYAEDRAEGLMTASGAIGLLFPPSLAVIVYGSTAQVSILDLFKGGIVPGLLLVFGMAAIGIAGDKQRRSITFSSRELFIASKKALGELALPILIVIGYFSGILTLVETGAFAAFYVVVLEVFIKKDLSLKEMLGSALKSVPVTGGVLIIIAAARGLSDFLVDAEIPMILADLAIARIPSRWLFLLLLNAVLLVTGCIMDLFSAILVIAPLVIPVAERFGLEPVHLGILFLTNLSLGFLTPPVGMNLFIASYTFNRPLTRIYRVILPHLAVQLAILMLVTYIPFLTTWFMAK